MLIGAMALSSGILEFEASDVCVLRAWFWFK
jgi:hypothetical protein